MIRIVPTAEADYQFAFRLMRENMGAYHDAHQIPWDQDWVEANYRDKQNYSIFQDEKWVGFLSLEWHEVSLYVHTLQLEKPVQGGIIGYRVLAFLLRRAADRNISQVDCKSFDGNPALLLYQRLGFKIIRAEGAFVELRLDISDRRCEPVHGAGVFARAHRSRSQC